MQDEQSFKMGDFKKEEIKYEDERGDCTRLFTMSKGTNIFLIIDCKLVYEPFLESCLLSYYRPLCIMNGYFYLKIKKSLILKIFESLEF